MYNRNPRLTYAVSILFCVVCYAHAFDINLLNDVSMKIQQAKQGLETKELVNDFSDSVKDFYRFLIDRSDQVKYSSGEKNVLHATDDVKDGSDLVIEILNLLQNPVINEKVSSTCINDTGRLITGLLSGDQWAVQFFDATGKPGPSLTQFHFNFVGNYDQCRNAKAPPSANREQNKNDGFKGNYCASTLLNAIPFLNVKIGACLPSTCSSTEITSLFSEVLVLVKSNNITWLGVDTQCITGETEMTTATIVSIAILAFVGAMMILGTAYDVLITIEENQIANATKDSKHQNEYLSIADQGVENGQTLTDNESTPLVFPSTNKQPDAASGSTMTLTKIFLAFSVYSNGKKILSTAQPPGSLGAIHGIRFLSMSWVVLCHVYAALTPFSLDIIQKYSELLDRWTFLPISNGFVSVDTFFTLSGLLTSYLTVREMMRRDTWKINWPMFYFHRFWRLTPPYMFAIVIILGFQQYMGEGPLWGIGLDAQHKFCEENWWTNLLYVNNLVKENEMCLGQSWYLANDMQFFVLSPLMLIPFYFHRLAGLLCCCVFLLATWITTGVLSTIQKWPTTALSLNPNPPKGFQLWNENYYIVPWCRIGPFIVGIMAGYFLALTKGRSFRMNKWVAVLGWIISLSSGLAIVYGLRGDITADAPSSNGVAALYNAVSRSAWGACVSWVIIACSAGYGGPVNKLLSWSPFVVLGRLTYMSYLIHICIIEVVYQNFGALIAYNETTVVILFLGILLFVNMASFVCVLVLESPMVGLEKVFRRK